MQFDRLNPLEIASMTVFDLESKVVYIPRPDIESWEVGTITNYNGRYVFVLLPGDSFSKACDAQTLSYNRSYIELYQLYKKERDMLSQEDLNKIDYTLVPEHLRTGLRNYIESGYKPGSFLDRILRGEIKEAIMVADPISSSRLKDIITFLETYAPPCCYGDSLKVDNWISLHARNKLERSA